jgi:catechol-2,3-dioxygenase
MVVLQEDKGEWPLQHFAFTIDEADIERAAAILREQAWKSRSGLSWWMPSASLYFTDPDGHALELLAVTRPQTADRP